MSTGTGIMHCRICDTIIALASKTKEEAIQESKRHVAECIVKEEECQHIETK